MDLAGINRNNSTGACFNHATSAGRFLRSPINHANAELVVAVTGKVVAGTGSDRLGTGL